MRARVWWIVVYLATLTALAAGMAAGLAVASTAVASIPADAYQWRRTLVREAQAQWGISAPVADFAAQIHQESLWRHDAVSPVGARGMAQFMPATADWIAGAYPALGPTPQPASPAWAIRALVTYDRHIWERLSAADNCNRMAKTASGYNGGPGWVSRDERLAAARGLDPSRWWGHVETVNAGRSAAAWRENRAYPRRILIDHAPAYAAAGFGWSACDD